MTSELMPLERTRSRGAQGNAGSKKAVRPGTKVDDLPTPALVADLDRVEKNLQKMVRSLQGGHAKLRPHFKAHQIVSLAKRQLQGGAIGITCANLDQAEALVDAGIANVLIASEIAGADKIRRFVELTRRAPVIVAVDNAKVVADMSKAAGDRKHALNVVVDVDVRLGRCGVRPGEEALALARVVLENGLTLRGVMGYEGQVSLPPGEEKDVVAENALKQLTQTRAMLEASGIPVEIVSCGGTSDYAIAARQPGVTEIQAGSYLLMDTAYAAFSPEFESAVSIVTTVISKTRQERVVLDVGMRSMSAENGPTSIVGIPGLRTKVVNVEHTVMEIIDPRTAIEVGDRIEVSVGFIDQTLSLHESLYGIRGGAVEEVFPIAR